MRISFLADISSEDRARLLALAQTFRGRRCFAPDGMLLPPGCAEKCLTLFRAGYRANCTEFSNRYSAPLSDVKVTATKAVATIRHAESKQEAAA